MTHYTNFLSNTNGLVANRWLEFTKIHKTTHFYDIGSNDPYEKLYGAIPFFKPLFPDAQIYLFEAATKHEESMKRSGMPYAVEVLSDEDGKEITFYESKIAEGGGGDSYYLENTKYYNDENRIETKRKTVKLDTLVEKNGWEYPDVMKLDTQGSEIDILNGASKCLEKTKFVVIECSVQEYNQGNPLASEVVNYMSKKGFIIYDIFQMHYHHNATNQQILNQVDFMFCKADLEKVKIKSF